MAAQAQMDAYFSNLHKRERKSDSFMGQSLTYQQKYATSYRGVVVCCVLLPVSHRLLVVDSHP